MSDDPADPIDPDADLFAVLIVWRNYDPDVWTEGNVVDLGRRLMHLRQLTDLVRNTTLDIEEALAASMENDIVELPGVGRALRSETHTSTWRTDSASEQMRDDLARAVANSVSTDIATGEIDPMKRNVATATMRLAYEVIPSFSSLKQAGRKRLGLQIGDYRSYDTRYAVKIEEGWDQP